MTRAKKKKHNHAAGIQKPKKQLPTAGRQKYFIPVLIIALISLLAHIPVLQNDFVNLDDNKYIQHNPMLAAFNMQEIFSRYVEGNYHPLTMLTYSIVYQLFGAEAGAYHAVSLVFHLLNVILVFYAVLLLSNQSLIAGVAALLFGIHPLHVESVAWASELKNVQYAFFFLAAYVCYLRYLHEPKRSFYVWSLIWFLLSLLSKALAVTLPVVMLLTDYFKGRKLNAGVWLEKLPFFALSVFFGIIAIRAQQSTGAIQDLDVFPLSQRLVFACMAFMTYLFKLVFPFHLSAFYPYPIRAGDTIPAGFYVYVFLLLLLAVAVFYSLRYNRKIFFGIAFFAVNVLLVLQLLPVGGAIMADRYVYISSIGIFYLAGVGFWFFWVKKNAALPLKYTAAVLLGVAVIYFSAFTFNRSAVWKNGMTLWNDVIRKEPTVALAYNNRAALWMEEKKYTEALADYGKAISLRPAYAEAYQNRGVLLAGLSRYEEALSDYNKAISLKPGFAEAHNNRGMLYASLQQYDAALRDYNKAVTLKPDFASAYNNRGNLFLNMQRYDQALDSYRQAIAKDPAYAKAYNGWGVLLMRQQQYEEAIAQFNKAIHVQADYGEAYGNRAIAEYNLGRKTNACHDLQQALRLGYQTASGYYNQWCQ